MRRHGLDAGDLVWIPEYCVLRVCLVKCFFEPDGGYHGGVFQYGVEASGVSEFTDFEAIGVVC
jgi:hypothetical protein